LVSFSEIGMVKEEGMVVETEEELAIVGHDSEE
jgi:hypothetical protein